MSNLATRIEAILEQELSDPHSPKHLQKAMRYSVLNGGKRIRPLLVYAAGQCLGAQTKALDAAAIAVELIHCYSLVHDDLPAMDNDDLRRGKPTVHKAFDEATAILVGDALQTKAFETLSKPNPHLSPVTQLKLIQYLSEASGAKGMAGGQMLDILSEGKQLSTYEIEQIHKLKTGKLICASIMLGALTATEESATLHLLMKFGKSIGLAFQLKDDLLDSESDTKTLGKTAQLDQTNQKACALTDTTTIKTRTEELLEIALHYLQQLPQDTQQLAQLARYVITRSY